MLTSFCLFLGLIFRLAGTAEAINIWGGGGEGGGGFQISVVVRSMVNTINQRSGNSLAASARLMHSASSLYTCNMK